MKNWKQTLISASTTIQQALQIIDKASLQVALVVDDRQRLLGTVTDGDVRRGILTGVILSDVVSKIMNSDPVTAVEGDAREQILAIMKKRAIHQLPLLNSKGVVTGIETIDDLIQYGSRDNLVILMAGGLGSRLQPLTEAVPKPLLSVGRKPILETILENFIEYGFKRFLLSVNYKNEMLRGHFKNGSRWGIEIRYIQEDQRLGTAGALSLLDEKPNKPFFVMNADVLTKVNFQQLLNFHLENKADATMGVREYDFQVPYGVVKIDKHRIHRIDEKPTHSFFVNAGIYVLQPAVLKYVPKKKCFDMTQLFEKLIQTHHEVAAFPIHEYWLDIGRISDLERANGEFFSVFR